ncbi:MAG TPA: hypothetical protein VNE18_12240 [Rhodanobacter sp.]|nr:hypothetical protein [Rhodanobacter sp.]
MKRSAHAQTAALLRDVLVAAVPDLHRCCRDPWALIGSAAAWLAGAEVTVADLDVLTSTGDAQTLIGQWRTRRDASWIAEESDRFRSRFARFGFPGMAVEVMGGLELCGANGWEPVRVDEKVMVDVAGLAVPIPTVAEQVRLLQSFGRPKDLRRAALLQSLSVAVQPGHTPMLH